MSIETLRLPWPPSVNKYWRSRIAGHGRKQFINVYIGREGKAFRGNVQAAVFEQRGVVPPERERLQVTIAVIQPDRRSRDIDNLLKATLDALTHAHVWADDSQIDDLRVIRGRVQAPGWLEVTITRIETSQRQLELEAAPEVLLLNRKRTGSLFDEVPA